MGQDNVLTQPHYKANITILHYKANITPAISLLNWPFIGSGIASNYFYYSILYSIIHAQRHIVSHLEHEYQANVLALLRLEQSPSDIIVRQSCILSGDNNVAHRNPRANRSSHLGIHKQTNAYCIIPRSQTIFFHFKIFRNIP